MTVSVSTTQTAAEHVSDLLASVLDAHDRGILRVHQETRLRDLWERAENSTRGAALGRFSWDAFHALRPTPKAEFKAHHAEFEAARPSEIVKYYESSGTTGRPTPTMRTREDLAWNYASVALKWGEVVGTHDRCAILLPSDLAAIGDLIAGVCELVGAATVRCFPFTQGVVSWDRLGLLMETWRPTVLWSSPGTIVQLMRILKGRGAFGDLSRSVRTIMLSGEVASPALRGSLSREWGADVHDASYGSTETGTIAATGRDGSLDVLEYAALCEIDTGEGIEPLRDGLTGELLVTTLNAYARPLLRLATGDVVRVRRPAGRLLHTLDVLGRQEESVRLGGREVHAREVEDIVYAIAGVTGYVLQKRAEEIAALVLERSPDQQGADEALAARARAALAESGIAVAVKVVGQLPMTTKSGAGLKNWKKSNVIET